MASFSIDLVFAGCEDVVGAGREAHLVDDDVEFVVEDPFADKHSLISDASA